jgi:glutathione S-transferase
VSTYELIIANKNYSSWSLRPWILMKTAGIAFEERLIPFRGRGSANSAAFRKFSPSGKVPCLRDGDTLVWDSLAITEYLHERHDRIWPSDAKTRAWARSAAAEMHAGFQTLRSSCGMNCGIRVRLRGMTPELQRDIARIEELWDDGLARFGGPFLAGENFAAVDAFFCPVAFRVQTYGLPIGAKSSAYVKRLLALPAMRNWYQAALAETWRVPEYEADAAASGDVKADSRAMAV